MSTAALPGEKAVGFFAIGGGLLIAYAAFKNKSAKRLLVGSINPKSSTDATLIGSTSYGSDTILDTNAAAAGGAVMDGATGVGGGAGGIPAQGAAAQVVAYAMQQVGTPYVWGGAHIGGFDCSGLTMAAYASAGVKLPRVAQAQYEATKDKSTSTPGAGDLVFFGTRYNLHHVGIALGNGQMVDAPHTGASVRVESYAQGWDLFAATSPLSGSGGGGGGRVQL